jgi:hypothetical protein
MVLSNPAGTMTILRRCGRPTAVLAIVLLSLNLGLGSARATPPLSEADLGRLIELRIDDGAIVSKIQQAGIGFVADAAALGRLKQAGASGPVLDTLRQAGAAATGTAAARAVTYEDVLKLVQLGIDEDQILKRLQASPTRFTLDAAQVDELKQAGASGRLLAAMQGQRTPAGATAAVPAPAGDVTDFAIILDCSGSMMERTKEGATKMETAKRVVTELIGKIPDGLRLTFLVYGRDKARACQSVDVVRELSVLDAAGKTELMGLIARLQPVGATPIALALRTAGQELARNDAYRGLVLITDGKETCGGNPVAEAAALAQDPKLSFGIHVIGFDIQAGERAALEEIARAGKGEYHDARTGAELATALTAVGEELTAAALPPVPSQGPVTLQERATLEGHTSGVESVAFTPDGRRVASLSWNEVIIWDVPTARPRATFKTFMARKLALSPEGKTLAVGDSDGVIRLLSADRGNVVGTLKGHASEICGLVFSADGRTLASASEDRTARLWDVAARRRKATLQGHPDTINGLAISTNGMLVATGCNDRTVKLWDAATGRERATTKAFDRSDYHLQSIAFSPDGQFLAVSAAQPYGSDTLRLLSVPTLQEAANLHAQGHTGSLAFSPDGRLLVSGGLGICVRLWDVTGEKPLATAQEHLKGVTCVAFSPSGKMIASGSTDNTVKLWDVVPVNGTPREP